MANLLIGTLAVAIFVAQWSVVLDLWNDAINWLFGVEDDEEDAWD